MGVIDNIFEIWSDLELSYSKKGTSTRKEFLLSLIGYSDGRSKLDSLKQLVMANYDGERSDILCNVFDTLSENLSYVVQNDIDNLNELISGMLRDKQTESTKLLTIPSDFFERLNPYQKPETQKSSLIDHLVFTGFVTDVYRIAEDKITAHVVGLAHSKDVVIFKGGDSVKVFVERFTSKTDFYEKCHKLLSHLISNKRMPTWAIFLAKGSYKVIPSKGLVRVDSISPLEDNLRIIQEETLGDLKYTYCLHEGSHVNTPVFCMS